MRKTAERELSEAMKKQVSAESKVSEQGDVATEEPQMAQDDQNDVELVVGPSDPPDESTQIITSNTVNSNIGDGPLQIKEEDTSVISRQTRWFAKCQQTNVAHCCVDTWHVVQITDEETGHVDAQLEVVLVPEAFRMWFYYGWYMLYPYTLSIF